MKLLKTHMHHQYPAHFKELCRELDINTISDINSRSNIYYGDTNFLQEFGIYKNPKAYDTIISRIIGNIPPHVDNLEDYSKNAYLLVLDVSIGNRYVDSQSLPMLYQNKEFLGLHKGDLVEFNQRIEHALFWDRRIDIAVFWKKIIIKKRYNSISIEAFTKEIN